MQGEKQKIEKNFLEKGMERLNEENEVCICLCLVVCFTTGEDWKLRSLLISKSS